MGKDKYQDISDKELLQRFWQTQNNEWLGILLQRYTLLLLGVCMKYLKDETDARDCVQQIFLKVIQEAGKYRIDYFKSWLYMVAKNQCLTLLRDKKGKTSIELNDTNSQVAEDVDSLSQEGAPAVSDEMLQEALQELNEEQYKCVTLFYLNKKSYQEISENTGYPMLKVKSHIQNGKRNLKISIQKKMKAADSTNAR